MAILVGGSEMKEVFCMIVALVCIVSGLQIMGNASAEASRDFQFSCCSMVLSLVVALI